MLKDTIKLEVTPREFATIMAGLRTLENTLSNYGYVLGLEDIASNGGEFDAATADEVEELSMQLNCS